MHALYKASSSRRLLLILAMVVAELAVSHSARVVTQNQKQVLVLYSTRRDAQIVTVMERELPRIVTQSLGQTVDYYSEYIDQARFPDPDYQAGFRDFLRLKYSDRTFDVIVAIQDVAVEFLARNRDELFPATPLIFFANSPVQRIEKSTGVIGELHLDRTLALAAALHPQLRNVFVVSGAGTRERVYEALARKQLRPYETPFKLTYLSGLPTKELQTRLSALPPDSIVYYLLVYRDGAGENFQPLEYLDRLTAVANAPVYSWVDSAIGHGVVGGKLRNQAGQAESVARLVTRVLRGESVEDIPVSSPDLDVNQVDWRQLRRWGISEARVPPGTLVQFRVPGPWEAYRAYILGAAALVLAQTALIAGLLLQRARLRRAEEHMRSSEAQLRTSYGRIRDLGRRLLDAQETERSRIARELHDDIGQQLTLLTIDLELLAGGDQESPEQLTGEALKRAQTLATSVHDLSHRLHPAKLRLLGLVSALQALQRELSQSEISVVFTHNDVPSKLPSELTLCLFRIVQEALQNALKYSQATEVLVHLARNVQGLTLTIIDDGIGFDVNAAWGKGLGLNSMRERIDAVGGTLEVQSTPRKGTRLEVSVPVAMAGEAEAAAG